MHHKGIATLLLEHLVSYARSHQITTFTAETLTENKAMLNVFADAGLPVERHYARRDLRADVPAAQRGRRPTLDSYLNAVAERESRAEVASLRHVLAPESVAVIGASRRRGTVGRAILDNIRAGGYAGRLYTVNPRARQIGGERCLSSALDLPEPVDLAVIAVPAAGGARRGRAVRPARRAVPGGDHLRAGHRRLRRPARGVPQARHAAGRPGLLRGGRARHRPGRHVRRQPGPAGRDRAWSCSPAAWASPWSTTCPGSASGSPRSRRSATSSTCRATTC